MEYKDKDENEYSHSDYSSIVLQISLGSSHIGVLIFTGEIVCWGSNILNQLINTINEDGWIMLKVNQAKNNYCNINESNIDLKNDDDNEKNKIEIQRLSNDESDNIIVNDDDSDGDLGGSSYSQINSSNINSRRSGRKRKEK